MALDTDCLVSVISPLHNDARIIRQYLLELHTVLSENYANFEILLIDDGSTDGTGQIVAELLQEFDCVRYFRLSRRFGIEIAIAAGFETAIGDYIAICIPEFDPVRRIPQLITAAKQNGTVVIGRANLAYPFLYSMVYRSFYWFCNSILSLDLVQNTTYFIALGRPVLNSINQIKDKFRYIKTFTNFLGFKVQFFDYKLKSRTGRNWRRSLGEAINLGIDVVVSNSVRPLRFVSLLGIMVSGVNFAYFGYIALIAFFKDRVAEGWITLSTQIALGLFVLSIVLATVCEYLARILVESKERPSYFVLEEKNSSVLISKKDSRKNVVNSSLAA